MSRNGADVLVECLMAWGVDVVFGMPGDGINGVMESIRTHSDRIRFIQVRNEESAAFMACAYAKFTGKLGCCLATTGPGGNHLLNGLYDAKFDKAPVLAITGLPYHDLIDTFTQQDIDHSKVFQDVALYTARVMSPMQVENTVGLACRIALTHRGVAHVAIPVDVQEEPEAKVKRSDRNVPHHASFAHTQSISLPDPEAVARAADILNAGNKVAILAGQGAYHARDELIRTAELLGAPIVKALLGKGVVADDHPLTTGGIGLLGTRPSQEAFEQCDAFLIVGSTFPYIEYYPKPDQARGVQIDRDPTRIGLRFPAEVGLVGDARAALEMLNAQLKRKEDRRFLEQAQQGMAEWRRLLQDAVEKQEQPMKPGRIAHDLNDRLDDNAVVTWDSGHNTGLLARYIEARGDRMFSGSGLLASMGCGVPYAVAAALAFPGRQVVAFVGDGGLSMLLGELATIVRYRLPIKIVVVKNNTLGRIKWEQMMFLGNPEYECDLTPIDFVKVAEGFGIRGFRVADPQQCGRVLDQALGAAGSALVEAIVDPNDPLLPPKRMEKYAKNLEKALHAGTPGREAIERALAEEPAHTMLQS
ncbi:thiamine pyrophosphate-dependent enzyme [Microvirga rosea]|uniref:thiamine pyrophosphate-dependent enzyme n=1 Tax=Microvirga rosea TaxID=2715425 RepID=UPI001D0AEC0B|nr:thiamine pyrophosphate-dependent enzyme [Microvirga rosea]MCB8822919.1 thiamine pyrophosphate-dependent enzyme [Microvirga rosea]